MELVNIPDGPNNSVSEQTGLMAEYPGKKDQPDEPNMTAPYTANGCHDNGTRNDGSNPSQVQPTTDESSEGRVSIVLGKVTEWVSPLNPSRDIISTRLTRGTVISILSIIILSIISIIILISNSIGSAFSDEFTAVAQQKSPVCPSCPEDWISWNGKCYYFSDAEGTWNSSQNNCTLQGASLFVPGPEKEMAFIRRIVGYIEHWIGLRREKEGQPWKWPNGSVFNNSFEIGANGPCAYLDKKTAGSTLCDTERNWICTKSLPTVY